VLMRVPVPQQDGAWGMLYVPYLTAVFCVGTFDVRALLTFLLLTVGFFIQEPLLGFIRIYPVRKRNPEGFSFMLRWFVFYLVAGCMILAFLMHVVWRP